MIFIMARNRNEMVINFSLFFSVPFAHQAALFFPLNHKINKALLKDLFRKIAFKGRDLSLSSSGTIEQVDRSGICCTEIMLSDSLRWWKFQVSIELSMGVDEFLGSILIFSVPRMWFVRFPNVKFATRWNVSIFGRVCSSICAESVNLAELWKGKIFS